MDSQLPSFCGPPPGSPHSRERPRQLPAGTEVRYLPCLYLESSMGQIPGSAFIPCCLWPAGQVSLLGRQDTDCTDSQSTLFFYQIYSPDPATSMEHSRSDLLFPHPFPSLWNTGPHSHGQSPSPTLHGGKTGSAQDETPRKPPPGLAVYPGWPNWEEQPSQTGHTHSPPNCRNSPALH